MASETRLWLAGPNGGAVPVIVPFGAAVAANATKIINGFAPLFHGRLVAAQLVDGATIAADDTDYLRMQVRKNGTATAFHASGTVMAGPMSTRLTTAGTVASFGVLTLHVPRDLVVSPSATGPREAALVDNDDQVYIEKDFVGAGKALTADARITLWWVGGWNADPNTNPVT